MAERCLPAASGAALRSLARRRRGGVSDGRARLRGPVLLILGALILAGCGSGEADAGADGATVTMWTRAATEAQTQAFVDAYNELGRSTVELTVVPNDSYLQQVATAAGGRNLPDVLAADVVYAASFVDQGFYTDITDRVAELDFAGELAPAHMDAGTADGQQHVVPHTLDLSALFYNKVLYEEAGLDPEAPPTTLEEMRQQAEAIDALGGDVNGSYFGGSCAGCLAFTFWPSIWADGGEVINAEGTRATLDSPKSQAVFEFYRSMFEDGLVPASAQSENGATWVETFAGGTIGIAPLGSTTLRLMDEGDNLQIGVAPIPGLDGGQSSFVGGDVVGVSATSEEPDAAWDFISWTLSDEAQLEVLAANGDVTSRLDLADNQYAAEDPRTVVFNEVLAEGRTPKAVNFGPTFNDPNGPWPILARDALFGEDPAAGIEENNAALSDLLSP